MAVWWLGLGLRTPFAWYQPGELSPSVRWQAARVEPVRAIPPELSRTRSGRPKLKTCRHGRALTKRISAVSRERQFASRLLQARLISYLQTPRGGLGFGAGFTIKRSPQLDCGVQHGISPLRSGETLSLSRLGAPSRDGLPRQAGQSAWRVEGSKTGVFLDRRAV